MKVILIVFISCNSLFGFGQIQYDFDTLFYSYRISGNIDTVDIANSDMPTLFDGGQSILSTEGLSVNRLTQNITSESFNRINKWESMKFSALPHLGFAYSFGAQGTSFLHVNYSQSFGKTLLNIDYNLAKSNGYIRNSAFQKNDLKLQLQRTTQRYSFQFTGKYRKRDVGHSNGIVTDTLLEELGLEFMAVNKSDALSYRKEGILSLNNYLNFTNDSLNHFGIITSHYYQIKNRVYSEFSDTLQSIYTNTFIDTMQTSDQSNFASIRNAAGLYYSKIKSRFYIDGQISHTYWDFQNLGIHTDTNEIGFLSNARIKLGQFTLENNLNLNLSGSFNEFSDLIEARYSNNKFNFNGHLLIENLSPLAIQRKYHSNNYDYKLSSINKQNGLQIGGKLNYKIVDSILKLGALANFSSLDNVYLFDGIEWRNDTLGSFNFVSIGVFAELHYKALNLSTRFTYSIDDDNYLPDYQVNSRLYLKGKLFEAKKLEATIGVEGLYFSDFNARVYNPSIGAYNWYTASSNVEGMFNMHGFVAFGIDEFKFYIRYENISYHWNNKTAIELEGYPISGPRMRVGITWDFFN